MRATFKYAQQFTGHSSQASAAQTTNGTSIPSPVGGWDAYNPLAAMPPQNAVQLVNFFPQPGWVELRRGALNWCDTGTGTPVETVMSYQAQDTTKDIIIAASGGKLFDVTTTGSPTTLGTGFTSNRWQWTDFAGTGGSFIWMANGEDRPQYWDGSSLTATTLTGSGFTATDVISPVVYRSRIWAVVKGTTKAIYLGTDAVDGACGVFDVGNDFLNGGYLQAIGTWSTDAVDGPQAYISFISSQGDVAVYIISDPTQIGGIVYRGRAEISNPVGWRCVTEIGSDLGIITLDGVLPLSQVLSYDKAALIGASITKNIRAAITQAVRDAGDNFGWQLQSYPRNTMAILNVPLTENSVQEQYVMNTITGAWARFTGQNASCWTVFHNRPYFGDNAGVVWLADEAAADENQTLTATMQCAFNYYGDRGHLKNWKMIRPNLTIDQTFPVSPQIGLNLDFGTDAVLDPINFQGDTVTAMWDISLWDQAVWPGTLTVVNWAGIEGYGYCSSIAIQVTIPWTADLETPKVLQFNGFDVLYATGAFI